MVKLALIILGILALSGGTFYLVYIRSNTGTPVEQVTQYLREVPKTLPEDSQELGEATASAEPSAQAKTKPASSDTAGKVAVLENKVKSLESSILNLSSRITQLEGGSSSTTTSSSTSKSPQYIYPLGYGGSTTASDWTEISTFSITIDPSLYTGYKDMKLEALIRVKDGNGRAYAKLYSSGTAITLSEVSTTSYQNTWVSSSGFTVSTKKTYTFQVKSLTGYEAFLENARVVVNF